jgi:hypothetical protein
MTLADLIKAYHDAYAKSIPFVQAERAGMRAVVEMIRDDMHLLHDTGMYFTDILGPIEPIELGVTFVHTETSHD